MKTRIAAATLLVLLAAAGAWLYLRQADGTQDLPAGALRGHNVLLVTIDTLRLDRIGAYGSTARLTPTLDQLAAQGLRFDAVHTPAPLTLPSHASLMTARIPPHHGVRDNGTYRLDPAQPTLAAALKSAGYRTAAFVGAFVLDRRFGLAQGFDLYDDHYGEPQDTSRVEVVERRAEEVTAPAAAWIQAAQAPWFAWVHVYDPHEPYAAPEPFASQHPSSPYDGEVAYTDAALGRMLDDLQRAGRLDRTLLIVLADHGEALGERGERTHGLFAYESTLRVPLIVWSRDRIQPGVIADQAGLVDVAPTILDLVGVPFAAGDGRSLRARLAGEELDRQASRSTYFEALNANLTRNWAPLTGIVSDGLKLIDLPVPELYDLRADPREAENLYARRPDDARRLERMLDAAAGSNAQAPGASVDTETAARLRSLGYVVSQAQTRQRKFTADDDPKNLVAIDAALDEAMKISGRGDHASAVTMLQDVIRQRPNLPVAYDRLAFVLRASGRLPDAIGVLEQAASKGYADAPVLVSLGTMLQEAGRLDRSVAVLEAAVGMNAQDVDARSRLGVLYLRMDRREEAIATLQQALAIEPTLANARNTLAVAYAKGGDLPRAVEEWRQLALARPNDPDILYNIGTGLLQLGRTSEARPFLERFIAAAPPRYASDVDRIRQTLATMPR
jgi:arylsulfatase A-like enzyme/Tfp pilus assembly protein PilF